MQITLQPVLPAKLPAGSSVRERTAPANQIASEIASKAALKNEKAALDFEALLLGPVLDALQKTFAGEVAGSMVGASDYRQMASQALAKGLAAKGGIGIARMVLEHLQQPANGQERK